MDRRDGTGLDDEDLQDLRPLQQRDRYQDRGSGGGNLDLGILHYASDTPYSQRASLLSKSLGYEGIEATYACALAILERILGAEADRLRRREGRHGERDSRL